MAGMTKSVSIVGITRKSKFSPNHIGNDSAIFNEVIERLTLKGALVEVFNEDEFMERGAVEQMNILTMGRTKSLVKRLQTLEKEGKQVINSAYGIENCFRKNMTLKLLDGGIPYPQSIVVSTSADISGIFAQMGGKGVWLKRGDFHAIHKEDVTFVATAQEAQQILNEYALRCIKEAVVSEHLAGDLVKFYAVRGTDFFYWFYPYEHNHHKYAVYEQINDKIVHFPFVENDLEATVDQAAKVLGVTVYGGDAIIGPDGKFHIIDLNDWPSFAPCRAAAAEAIADIVYKKFSETHQNGERKHQYYR